MLEKVYGYLASRVAKAHYEDSFPCGVCVRSVNASTVSIAHVPILASSNTGVIPLPSVEAYLLVIFNEHGYEF